MMDNTWQREFPWQHLTLDRYDGTSPVKAYAPNGYGIYDMAGNVWEWTADLFTAPASRRGCCAPGHSHANERFPRRVIKGESHLCAPNYCLRYRPAARQGESVDTSTSHIAFRCVARSNA